MAGYQPARRNRVCNVDKNDRDSLGSVLGGHGSGRIGRDDQVNFKTDQLIGQAWESVELTLGVSILENDLLPVDIAEFAELSLERFDRGGRGRRTDCKPADLRYLCLLRIDGNPNSKEAWRKSAKQQALLLTPDH